MSEVTAQDNSNVAPVEPATPTPAPVPPAPVPPVAVIPVIAPGPAVAAPVQTVPTPVAPVSNGKEIVYAGMDLGTNSSCICISLNENDENASEVVPSVVGYAEEGILSGILPGDSATLYGNDAIRNELHLRTVRPLKDGVIYDLEAATGLACHIREKIDPKREKNIKCVVGIPAGASDADRESLQQAVGKAFDSYLFIPEPFLAALGYRDETQLSNPDYNDPVKNSLFIDIGAGTTDFCIIQGYYPTDDDQMSIPFAGDNVDKLIAVGIQDAYPETRLSDSMIRKFKEEHSYIGELKYGLRVKVPVGGKPKKIDIGKQIGTACNVLLDECFRAIQKVISMASSESVFEMLQNIIITGGGSRIKNIAPELQRLLLEEGYENPQIQVAGYNYKEYVAKGAFKAAQSTRDNQWESAK